MIRHHMYYLLLASVMSVSNAIRVDWNTNTGPIIPPTSTGRPSAQKPYRQPAPVWETDDNDSSNPYPYHYILPPPSRPRPSSDNYARASPAELLRLQNHDPFGNYGQFVHHNTNGLQQNVRTLGVQHVPNKGVKYFAVAPTPGKVYHSKAVDSFDAFNKLNGQYNSKLKKYKAYEKLKHVNYSKYMSPKYQQPQQEQFYSTMQKTNYQQQLTSFQAYQNPPVRYHSVIRKRDTLYRPRNIWEGFSQPRR